MTQHSDISLDHSLLVVFTRFLHWKFIVFHFPYSTLCKQVTKFDPQLKWGAGQRLNPTSVKGVVLLIVCQGGHNKISDTGWLKLQNLFLPVAEARSVRSGCWYIQFSCGLSPWLASCGLLAVCSYGHLSVYCMCWCQGSEQAVQGEEQKGRGPEWFLSTSFCHKASHRGHVGTEIGVTDNPRVCQDIQCSVHSMVVKLVDSRVRAVLFISCIYQPCKL